MQGFTRRRIAVSIIAASIVAATGCNRGPTAWDTGLAVEKRLDVITEIAQTGGAGAHERLQAALETDPDIEVRSQAIRGFGELKDGSAVPLIAKHVHDDAKAVRISCGWALGQIATPATLEPLGVLLHDSDTIVRGGTLQAISRVGGPEATKLLAGAALSDPDDKTRDAAIEHLGHVRDKSAIPIFEKALQTETDEIRAHAARAIGQLADRSSIPALAKSLDDPSPVCRGSAALAIAAIGDVSGIVSLKAGYDHEGDDLAKTSIAWAGAKLGDKDLRARLAEELLTADEDTARAQAARALADINACEAVPSLRKALNDRKGIVRTAAADALGAMKCS